MADYAIYSFEIQEGNRSLFYKNTNTKAIDMANEIVYNVLKSDFIIVGKKKKQDQRLEIRHFIGRDNVFSWDLCNVKDIVIPEGHEKTTAETHPGCYVIVDNRPDVCQIAIEKNGAFGPDTDKVVKYINRTFKGHLEEYGLKIVIKRKYQARKFKELIRERIVKNDDSVKKVVWEFPNPDKVKGIDANEKMKGRLEGLGLFIQASNVLKGKLTLSGHKGDPIDVDDETIEDWAQIIALSAQNSYKLSYYFFNSPMVSFKDVAYAIATIDNKHIRDFEDGYLSNKGEGTKFELIKTLNKIRKEIADYDHEKIVDNGE